MSYEKFLLKLFKYGVVSKKIVNEPTEKENAAIFFFFSACALLAVLWLTFFKDEAKSMYGSLSFFYVMGWSSFVLSAFLGYIIYPWGSSQKHKFLRSAHEDWLALSLVRKDIRFSEFAQKLSKLMPENIRKGISDEKQREGERKAQKIAEKYELLKSAEDRYGIPHNSKGTGK